MFELDASSDINRNSAIDKLFRYWLQLNLEGDFWQTKKLHQLATTVGINLKSVFSVAAGIAGVKEPTISDNGRRGTKMIRRLRPTDIALDIITTRKRFLRLS